uniref:mediator of RNA polymerase II transcription subunit 10-like n=1 Tax=Styela clava TaxID=7725 RepID=UPI001939A5CD|nr:mediator of RNA polymerase II transcription subunit 10-like [Styela clava]
MAEKFEQLEENLEQFIENVRQLGIIASDFQPQGQAVLNQKINSMITGLKDIEACKSSLQGVNIPLEVFDYIDDGKNPQLYTKHCIEKALTKNEDVKGKIEMYQKFQQELLSQLSTVYPEQMNEYKALRKNT